MTTTTEDREPPRCLCPKQPERGQHHTDDCRREVVRYARNWTVIAASRRFGVSQDAIRKWMKVREPLHPLS